MLTHSILGIFYPYGIMLSLGFLAAILIFVLYAKHARVPEELRFLTISQGFSSLAIGGCTAILFQTIYNYIENPSDGFRIVGATFFGGLIGGGTSFFLQCCWRKKKRGVSFAPVVSILPCSLSIAHAFGRVGCFFAGCCYGRPTESTLGVKFPFLEERVHPTQLYEAVFLLCLFALLSCLLFFRRHRYNAQLYFIVYGCFRFWIEFLRGDERGRFVGTLSPSQFWSIAFVVFGATWIVITHRNFKKETGYEH